MDDKEKAREATRAWRARNRDKVNAAARVAQKKWRDENPELHRARARAYAEANREKRKAKHTEWRKNNRDHVNAYRRAQHFKHNYGMTIEARDAMVLSQGWCAICHCTAPRDKVGWVVDHCHTSGVVRSILCNPCNVVLGKVEEDVSVLRNMISYLEKHNVND
jgi:hypothetical protein